MNIDNNKAVFSLLKNNVVDKYRQNPELYDELTDRIDDYFKPLSDKEEALITAGKQDAIGDHQTFKSLFSELDSEITAIQKALTAEHKNSAGDWFQGWAAVKLENDLPWSAEDTTLFIQQFGTDASTWINKAKVLLTSDKNGVGSTQFMQALGYVARGLVTNEEGVQGLVQKFHLTNDVASKLNGLVGVNKSSYKENISMLEKSSITSDGRIQKLVQNTFLQNYLAPILDAENETLEDLFSEKWMEGWYLVINKVKWPQEVRFILETVQSEVAKNQAAIYTASLDRVYDDAANQKYGRRTFAPEEASAWAIQRTEAVLKLIEDLGEWEVVEEDQNGTKVRLLKKKESK